MNFFRQAMPRRSARSSLASLSSEVWLADRETVEALLSEVSAGIEGMPASEIRAFLADYEPEGSTAIINADGVAHVAIRGPMMRQVPWVFDLFGIEATSTESLRAQIQSLDASDEVEAIVLHVDSPGGTVSGTAELADALFAAQKPTHAHASGMAASAAYWVASQADRFTAEPSATVGSIGAYATIVDASKALEEDGIKVHVLRSGEHKGAGAGDEVTASQLSQLQSTVDAAAGMFLAAVERAREIDGLRDKADGRTYFAREAFAEGLIDGVETVEAAVAAATPKGNTMNEEQINALLAERLAPLEEALDEARGRAEAAEQKAKTAEDALVAQRRGAVEAAVARGVETGRITAENKPAVDAYVEAFGEDPTKVEAFIGTLSPQTRPEPQGSLPAVETTKITSEQTKYAQAFSVNTGLLSACESPVSWTPGVGFTTADGRVVKTLEELN